MQMNLGEYEEELNEDNVQYYCRHSKELKKTSISKALKFIKFDCIRYIGNKLNDLMPQEFLDKFSDNKNVFLCLPLNTEQEFNFFGHHLRKNPYPVDYNSSEYIIYKPKGSKTFVCNCQGWQTKLKHGDIIEGGVNCSHVLALYYMFKLRRFGK